MSLVAMNDATARIQLIIKDLNDVDSFKVLKLMKPDVDDFVVNAIVESKGTVGQKYAIYEYIAGRAFLNGLLRGRN